MRERHTLLFGGRAPWGAAVVTASVILGCSPPPAALDAGFVDAATTPDTACLSGEGASTGPWLRCAGGAGIDRALAVAASADGDVVVGGNLGPDPRIGDRSLTISAGFPQDAFIARYDREGRLRWAHSFGSEHDAGQENSEAVFALAADATGHTVALGRLVADADCGDGVVLGRTPPPLGVAEMYTFLARFSPEGRCLWSRRLSGHEVFNPMDVGVDAAGNVYVTDGSVYAPDGTRLRMSDSASFFGGVDLAVHPGGSTSHLGRGSDVRGMTIMGHTFEREPTEYVFQLEPDGAVRWGREMPARSGFEVTVDLVSAGPDGEVRVHGTMIPGITLDFGGGVTVAATSTQQGFAVAFDRTGQALRAFLSGETNRDPFGRHAAFAPDGSLVTAGSFQGSLSLDPTTTLRASTDTAREAYFAWFDSTGQARWVERLIPAEPTDYINATYVTVDPLGDVVLVGATSAGLTWRGESVPRVGETGMSRYETVFIAKAPGAR